jgi:ATP-dependent Zn protease
MVTHYGMSPSLGAATLQHGRAALFLPEAPATSQNEYSERTAQLIDEEVRRLLSEAETRVRETLSTRRPQLEAVARALLSRETIERDALLVLLRSTAVPSEVARLVATAGLATAPLPPIPRESAET